MVIQTHELHVQNNARINCYVLIEAIRSVDIDIDNFRVEMWDFPFGNPTVLQGRHRCQ